MKKKKASAMLRTEEIQDLISVMMIAQEHFKHPPKDNPEIFSVMGLDETRLSTLEFRLKELL